MPRSNNSKSRSRSPKRWKRYERQSSESDRGHRRKVRYQQPSKIQSKKSKYDIEAKSDIKNHIRYDNIPASSRRQEQKIMEQTEEALRTEYGSIQHITKVDSNQNEFSFVVGFKYDRDAYNFIKADSHYLISDKKKVYAKPTAVFEQCIPLIRQAKKQLKSKNKSRSPSKRRNNHSTSSQRHKKKRQKSKDRRDSRSYQRNQREQNKKKVEEKSVWIFGLPWSIKGPQIVNYLEKHPAGSFYVSSWKWVRAPETNCELMKVTMDAKKAQKLLAFRQQHSIQGSPCIITNCSYEQNPEAIKESLKQYQFKISFPQKINPASLYKVFNQNTTVVQIVSCYRLEDGRSDAFIVTLGNATKAREVKRLSLRQSGIRVEDIRGQLVYRPTKHSKLIENQRSH